MDKATLTVFFDGTFWSGVFERTEDGKLSACRVVFGAEPRDAEVWDFVLRNYSRLRFGPAVDAPPERPASNPKRLRREARRQAEKSGVGTKSQQALNLQREAAKTERQSKSREQKLSEKERKYALRREKKKQKHRGK